MLRNLLNFRFRLTAAIFLVAVGATLTGLAYYYQIASKRIWSQMTNRVKDYGKIGASLFTEQDIKLLTKLDADLNAAARSNTLPGANGPSLRALADDEKNAVLRKTSFQLLVQKLRRLRYSSGHTPVHESTLPAVSSGNGIRPLIHRVWIAGVKMHQVAPEFLRVLCADEFEEIDRNSNNRIDPEETIYHIGDVFNGRGQAGITAALAGEMAVGSGYRKEYSGAYITGYTPIKNAKGITVAILIVDFSAASEFDALFGLKVTGYYIIIGVLLFSIAAASVTSRFLLKPLDTIQQAAIRIGQRDFSVRIETKYTDELADLAYAINLMAHELGEYSTNMEKRIATRTGEISGILDALEQGLLTVDAMGTIQGEYSRQTLSIFGVTEIAQRKFSSLFSDEKLAASVDKFLEVSFSGQNISRQMLDKANPLREIAYTNANGEIRHLRFAFRPLNTAGDQAFSRLLVSIVDDTLNYSLREKIHLAEADKRDEFDLLLNLVQVPPRILENFIEQQKAYLKQGKALISGFDAAPGSDFSDFSRQVHALKGNALQLGFSGLSGLLHELETYLQAKTAGGAQDERYLRHVISRCINDSERLIIDRDKLITRIRKLVAPAPDDPLTEIRQLRRFWISQIEQKAAEKEVPAEAIVDFAAGTETALHLLHNTLVQLLRNTFAHGIESTSERLERGRGPDLIIKIGSERRNNEITVTYSEDGKGFSTLADGETVSLETLLQKRLTAPKKSITLESGRGLGMEYIMATIHKLGGKATVSSFGGLTTFTIQLPD
ncbi:MAG: HAMP domain-containing protein [Turneriella sp.]